MRGWRLMLTACALAIAGAGTAHARALVVGGANAPAGSWPALAALAQTGQTPYYGQFCGGTLVDQQWVLTAAHCTFKLSNPNDPTSRKVPRAAGDLYAALGITDLTAPTGSQSIGISQIVRHPRYDSAKSTPPYDIAMLHLAAPANLTANPPVATMDLAAPTDVGRWGAGAPAEIAGWGLTENGSVDGIRQATVPLVSDAACDSAYGASFVANLMVCAGSTGIGACQGDSGGPLTVIGLNGTRVLVGATSFSVIDPCAQPGFPAVFTELDAFRSFVYGTIGGINPPGILSAPVAAVSPGGATLAWTAPTSNGRPIAGYRITTLASGVPVGTLDVPGNTSSVLLGGLACGSRDAFTVAAANAAGLAAASSPSNELSPDTFPPSNTSVPTIGGTLAAGKALTASAGGWSSCSPTSYEYQWLADHGSGTFTPIPRQTGSQYVPGQRDGRLRVRVTARNGVGATQVESAPTASVPPIPANFVKPTTSGNGRIGMPLTGITGRWNVTDGFTFQWTRETGPGSRVYRPIPGATGATYVPRAPDVHLRVRFTVTVINASGGATAASFPTMVLPRFRLRSTRAPRVAQSAGVTTIRLLLQTESRSRLEAWILDGRGRRVAPLFRSSRFAGKVPRLVSGRRLIADLGTGTAHPVTIALRGRSRGSLQSVRVVIVAISAFGERAETAVRVRVRR